MSTFEQIQAAYQRVSPFARRTPLLSSPFLDAIAGRRVWIKAECLQHTGSFKFRGAWNAISALSEGERANGVIAFSSGNHAQGVALAASRHDCSSLIIMPSDAPKIKIENTRALGAEVVLYNRATEDRDAVAERENRDNSRVLIKPFDNEFVIAGQGTTGLEIAEQAAENDISECDVLVCCGGGGLTSGIALALEQTMPNATVHPIEPKGFDDVTRSLASGKIEKNAQAVGSICDAIITASPGEMTFPILNRLCAAGVVVSDEEAMRAVALAYERLRIVIEPGGAVALAAALFHTDKFSSDDVIAVATGGNVDNELFTKAITEYGAKT